MQPKHTEPCTCAISDIHEKGFEMNEHQREKSFNPRPTTITQHQPHDYRADMLSMWGYVRLEDPHV